MKLPKHIVADAGYGSEQNYDNILVNRKREALITYNMYVKEHRKPYKQNEFNTSNCASDEENYRYTYPNQQQLEFKYRTTKTDKYEYTRAFVKTVPVATSVHSVQKQKKERIVS